MMNHLDHQSVESPSSGVLQSPPSAEVLIDGRSYLYFAGTAYFALQGHPNVIQAGCDALQRYGVHSATSRGGFGNTPPMLDVEALAAQYFGAEKAFYFLSGYWGNNVIVQALEGRFDAVFYDAHSHYSVLESLKLSGRPTYSFAHRDAGDLSRAINRHLSVGERPLVISDGIFASSGRITPADKYIELLSKIPGSSLVLDDAHAVGVLGEGRGTFAHFGVPFQQTNLHPDEPGALPVKLYSCGTLSKAIGGSGGVIAGSSAWISHVKTMSRYFNAASSPPAAVAGATAAALRLVMSDPSIRSRQQANALQLRSGLRALGLDVDETAVPFTSLVAGNQEKMQMMQRVLRERGIIIAYIAGYSGVPISGQLRIAISSAHTPPMIQRLLQEIASFL